MARKDVPRVAGLYELTWGRTRSRRAPPDLCSYFERMFLDNPWVDPEIPSLVLTDERDDVVSFLGSTVRAMRFDGCPVRMASSGPFVTDPEYRSRGVGAFLMRRFLAGPQDLSISDGATEATLRLYTALGGELVHLSSIGWLHLFRPLGAVADSGEHPSASLLRLIPRPLYRPLDALAVRLLRGPSRSGSPGGPALEEEPLTPERLLEHLPAVAGSLLLRPDYDRPFLEWLFRELADVRSTGTLWARLLRDPRRGVLGWYVCHLKRGGLCRVLQIAAAAAHVGRVVEHLVDRAHRAGAAGLSGRLEPGLVGPLAHHRSCVMFARPYLFAVAHSRNPEILGAIHAGRALLTRMDGEYWMDFRGRSFT